MIKSILAILAGFAAWSVLWLAGNAALGALFPAQFDAQGFTRSAAILVTVLATSVVESLIAGYLTALVARRAPVKHALVLGLIQLGIGIAVQASVWERIPVWYHLSFLALLLPAHVMGGILRAERRPRALASPA